MKKNVLVILYLKRKLIFTTKSNCGIYILLYLYYSLWLLYGTVDPTLPARFQLYSDIIDVAKRNKQLLLVYGGIDSLNKSLISINHSKKQKQSLLRQLHSALIENGHRYFTLPIFQIYFIKLILYLFIHFFFLIVNWLQKL